MIIPNEITANEYQRAALRTAWAKTNEEMPPKVVALLESGFVTKDELLLLNGALGLSGEAGEVSDIVKKATFQGHELDKAHIAEELGDVAWYLAVAAHAIGYDLGEIFRLNVEKLLKRYPDGFDQSRSINRKEDVENDA